jgi:GNAT superfamily N-acetyltransferase
VTQRHDSSLRVRLATPDDLAACGEVWRAGLDDYGHRLGRMPLGVPATSFMDLMGHLRTTDPDAFLVAERDRRVVAFVSAIRRGRTWFLSMLFVLPEEQGRGLGRSLLERVLPAPEDGLILATVTDSAQPISNALYSRYGIVPRVPLLELVGQPAAGVLGELPPGVRAVPFEELVPPGATADAKAPAGAPLRAVLGGFDQRLLGYVHPEDHAHLARGDRRGFVYLGPDGAPLGYGYASPSGRIGPVAVADTALTRSVLGHLMGAVEPRGAFATWVAGTNGEAVRALLEAGLRIEDYPALLCWSAPFADLERYVPITLALV